MEIVELVSIDRQSAVGEDLKYGVEVSKDIAAQECVLVSSAEHIAPSECNVEHIVFSLKAEEGNVTGVERSVLLFGRYTSFDVANYIRHCLLLQNKKVCYRFYIKPRE